LTEEAESSPRIKIRIESLSDLVFGLALSIGSLGFLSNQAPTPFALLKNIAFFGFSFLILVATWLGYSRTMAAVREETSEIIYLNLGLLFLVAIEPYLFFVLVLDSKTYMMGDASSTVYALVVGLMFLIQAALSNEVLKQDAKAIQLGQKHLHEKIVLRFKGIRTAEIVIGAAYVVSALPIFWQLPTPIGQARFVFWYCAFAVLPAGRGAMRKKVKNAETMQTTLAT
jgi:uncharacterized membrane protein